MILINFIGFTIQIYKSVCCKIVLYCLQYL